MSLTPAYDDAERRKKREDIELCGKNRGPHAYIPIEWKKDESSSVKRITRFMCMVCFRNVRTQTLLENYPEVSF